MPGRNELLSNAEQPGGKDIVQSAQSLVRGGINEGRRQFGFFDTIGLGTNRNRPLHFGTGGSTEGFPPEAFNVPPEAVEDAMEKLLDEAIALPTELPEDLIRVRSQRLRSTDHQRAITTPIKPQLPQGRS